jgi:hypothetical protein
MIFRMPWRLHDYSITSSARASSGTGDTERFRGFEIESPTRAAIRGSRGAVTEPRSAESLQQQSQFNLRAIATNIAKLLRSADKPPFAELPLFVGC